MVVEKRNGMRPILPCFHFTTGEVCTGIQLVQTPMPIYSSAVSAGHESTAAVISEIGRHITEATREDRENHRREQKFGLAVQRGHSLSILTADKENYDVKLESNEVPTQCIP